MKAFKSFLLIFSIVFVAVLSLTLVQSVYAWTIVDDPTGGDCTSIGKWSAKTKTCTLNTDVSEGIVIDSDNITLLCNGHSITWASGDSLGSIGIDVFGRNGVTIRDCIVDGYFEVGISLSSSDSATLKNNNVQGYQLFGIWLSSDNSTLKKNTAGGEWYGIVLGDSHNNNLNDNTASSWNGSGIALHYSDNNYLKNNIAYASVIGIVLDHSDNNYLNKNTVNLNNPEGISLYYSDNNYLKENTADNNTGTGYVDEYGINNTFIKNECSGNGFGSSPPGLCSPQP